MSVRGDLQHLLDLQAKRLVCSVQLRRGKQDGILLPDVECIVQVRQVHLVEAQESHKLHEDLEAKRVGRDHTIEVRVCHLVAALWEEI